MARRKPEELEQQEARKREVDALIERVANEIVRRGLETPAVMMLELNKPLTFLTSQSLLVAVPLLGAFIDPEKIELFSEALRSPDTVDQLIDRIEDLSAESDQKGSAPKADPPDQAS
jgi:hypothetical protein